MHIFKDIYDYRELLKTNVKKDIRGKYKGSFLGILWSFINPLLQVVVYWIVFPYLMRGAGGDNYLVYLITGLIPWTFFLTTVSVGTTSIKANAGIIKKVYFPREILLISQVLSGLVNFFISCIIIFVFCFAFGYGLSVQILMLPIVAFIQSILILGIILLLSSLNAYIQDLEYIVSFLLTMGMYATPVIYDLSLLDGAGVLGKIIRMNPLTILVTSYRDIFMYHVWPPLKPLGAVALLALVILVIGYAVFKKLEKGFAEEL